MPSARALNRYTGAVIPPPRSATANDEIDENDEIDWYPFLARPRLASPTATFLTSLLDACILVTGAGGSIGSALSLRLASLRPRKLILLDASEQALFRLESCLAGLPSLPGIPGMSANPITILGSVSDSALLREVFAQHAPNLVFHAAAYKHVALLESHPLAAIQNNALGTQSLIECACNHSQARMILLSTDKAVAPISILGATKRIAELLTLANGGTVLRLCNVLGTEGSVVETFLRQIAAGGPVTIAHPDAERYFITCTEAVDLLLTCAVEARPGALFVPAVQRPHRVQALAEFLIDHDSNAASLPIKYSGLRTGDKLSEDLWSANEQPGTANPQGLVELRYPQMPLPDCVEKIAHLHSAANNRDLPRALEILQQLVPDYTPSTTVLALARQNQTQQVCLSDPS